MAIAFVRTMILYLLIIVGIRLMGKRQIGELEPSELVLDLIIADLAVVPMQDFGIPLLSGIIPIFTLLCLTMILSVLTMKSLRFRTLLCGRPSVVVENGTICQAEMRKNRFTLDELSEELRLQGITDISTIKYAILETNGQLSVLPYPNFSPPNATDLGLALPDNGLPLPIISDGKLLPVNLSLRGLDETWLAGELQRRQVKQLKDVFLLTVDESRQVFFVPRELA